MSAADSSETGWWVVDQLPDSCRNCIGHALHGAKVDFAKNDIADPDEQSDLQYAHDVYNDSGVTTNYFTTHYYERHQSEDEAPTLTDSAGYSYQGSGQEIGWEKQCSRTISLSCAAADCAITRSGN